MIDERIENGNCPTCRLELSVLLKLLVHSNFEFEVILSNKFVLLFKILRRRRCSYICICSVLSFFQRSIFLLRKMFKFFLLSFLFCWWKMWFKTSLWIFKLNDANKTFCSKLRSNLNRVFISNLAYNLVRQKFFIATAIFFSLFS